MAAPQLDINSIMIIGGLPRHVVEGQFGKDLCDITGGKIVAHVPGGMDRCRSVTSIPAEVDAVLVIRDYVGHAASDTSKKAAAQKGIPYLAVSRKFSSAQKVLEHAGWAKPKAQKKAPVLGAQKLTQLAVSIICKIRREEGRVPSSDEVEEKLGKTISARFAWVSDLYDEACSRAAATTPLKPEDPTVSDERGEVYETIPVILESHPDLVLDLEALEARLRKFLGTDREYTANFGKAIDEAAQKVRRSWTDPKIRHKAQITLLRSLFRRFKEEGPAAFRSRTKIRDLMARIFDHRGTDEDFKNIRVEVFGEWARNMHKSPNAGRKFMEKKWAEMGLISPPPTVKSLVSMGLIESYTVPTGYHSSDQAILNYLDRVKPGLKPGLQGQSSAQIKDVVDNFLGAHVQKMDPEDIAAEEDGSSKIEAPIRSVVGPENPQKVTASLDDDVLLLIAETVAEQLDSNMASRFRHAASNNNARFIQTQEHVGKVFSNFTKQVETRLAPLGLDLRDIKVSMDKLNIQPTVKWGVDQIITKIVQVQSGILGKIRETNQMLLALASKVNEGNVNIDGLYKRHEEMEEEIGSVSNTQVSIEKKLDTIIQMMGDMEVVDSEAPLQGVTMETTEADPKVISVEKMDEDGSSKTINLTINL